MRKGGSGEVLTSTPAFPVSFGSVIELGMVNSYDAFGHTICL